MAQNEPTTHKYRGEVAHSFSFRSSFNDLNDAYPTLPNDASIASPRLSQNTNDLRVQVTYDMVILSVGSQDAWILVAEMFEGKILDGVHLKGKMSRE